MRVNLITSLTGYPYGTATAKRVNLIGKSIKASGIEFRVLTNYIQHNQFNTNSEGIHQDIYFQYLHKRYINENMSKLRKILYYLLGCFKLIGFFKKFDKNNDIVYSYNHGNLFNVYIIFLCKLFNIKLVQEINEWYHNDLNRKFEKLIVEGPLVKYSEAAIVISGTIKKKVLNINPSIKILNIPVLEDFSNIQDKEEKLQSEYKYCFWMGEVNGYLNDVLFIIQACANVFNSGSSAKLYISGPYNEYASDRIREVALQYNYPVQNIKLLGYLPEKELNKYCRNAYLFVVPLWNDERSKSRFPTKIASFMQTGKPIISCKIGEVGELFTDCVNILFYKEGDYNDLANKIQRLLIDNELYDRLAKESYDFALKNFNYLSYCDDLNLFFHNL